MRSFGEIVARQSDKLTRGILVFFAIILIWFSKTSGSMVNKPWGSKLTLELKLIEWYNNTLKPERGFEACFNKVEDRLEIPIGDQFNKYITPKIEEYFSERYIPLLKYYIENRKMIREHGEENKKLVETGKYSITNRNRILNEVLFQD